MKFIEHKGAKVPALGLGTYPMQGEQCYQAVRWALDIGYRHIDTAESYPARLWEQTDRYH